MSFLSLPLWAVLTGAGALTKTGTGTLTISGANNFTGGTVVDDGILAMGAHNVLPGTITLNGGVENGRYGGVLASVRPKLPRVVVISPPARSGLRKNCATPPMAFFP